MVFSTEEWKLICPQVMLKFLKRVNVTVELAIDGVQATDMVFWNPAGYYSIVLVCHMIHSTIPHTLTSISDGSHDAK